MSVDIPTFGIKQERRMKNDIYSYGFALRQETWTEQ